MQGVDPTVRFVGRYALYGPIASGGMATVHYGRLMGPVGFARTVAIKRLHAQYASDPEFVSMFLDEARLAARVRSPHVVPTVDVVSTDGELFLIMDYVAGESLARLAKASKTAGQRIPLSIVVAIMSGVLYGLHAAHEARSEQGEPLCIVHRDVSPENILVGSDGLARLLDFGIAKAAGRIHTTREGQLKGKLAYMAPEQLGGQRVSRATDVYAASVVLWETLTGERLFQGDDEGAVVTRVLMGHVTPPSRRLAERRELDAESMCLLERIDAIVMRGLEREPPRRFETAKEMALALENCVQPATAGHVSAWVEKLAGPVLAKRAADIAGVESDSPSPSHAPREPSRVEEPPTATIVTTPAARTRLRVRPLVLGGAALLGVAAISTMAYLRSAGTTAATASSLASSASPTVASSAEAPAESALPAAVEAAPSLATTTAPPTPSVAATPLPALKATSPARPAHHASIAAGQCSPAFTYDVQGKKHYKPECL